MICEEPLTQYMGHKKITIYFYCLLWLEVTKPGKSSVAFSKSWCATSVLDSQVFGQASRESGEYQLSADIHYHKAGTKYSRKLPLYPLWSRFLF